MPDTSSLAAIRHTTDRDLLVVVSTICPSHPSPATPHPPPASSTGYRWLPHGYPPPHATLLPPMAPILLVPARLGSQVEP